METLPKDNHCNTISVLLKDQYMCIGGITQSLSLTLTHSITRSSTHPPTHPPLLTLILLYISNHWQQHHQARDPVYNQPQVVEICNHIVVHPGTNLSTREAAKYQFRQKQKDEKKRKGEERGEQNIRERQKERKKEKKEGIKYHITGCLPATHENQGATTPKITTSIHP